MADTESTFGDPSTGVEKPFTRIKLQPAALASAKVSAGMKIRALGSTLKKLAKYTISPEHRQPSKRVRHHTSPDSDDEEVSPIDLDADLDSENSYSRDEDQEMTVLELMDHRIAIAIQPHLELIEKLQATIEAKDERIRELEAKLAKLEASPAPAPPVPAPELSTIHSKLDEFEQRNRQWNVRISGLKEDKAGNTDAIVLDIANTLEVDLSEVDIDWSHYISNQKPSNGNPHQIIVRFARRNIRRRFISARKRLRTLDKNHKYNSVYISEDLTQSRYKLLRTLIQKRKEGKLHSAWSFQGVLYYRLAENSNPTPIKDVLGFDVDSIL